MATALAYLFSDEGFVIAADGQNTCVSAQGFEVLCDDKQKIFPIHDTDREAAFSLKGRTGLYDRTESHLAFKFTDIFVEAVEEIRSEALSSGDFLSRVCTMVKDRLDSARRSVGIAKYGSRGRTRVSGREHTIVSVRLDGYFSGHPVRAGAEFYHIDQEVHWDLNSAHTLLCPKTHWTILDASLEIARLLFETDDTRLTEYRTDACRRVAIALKDPNIVVPLQDGVEAARNYIGACEDQILREIDIEVCQGIGGPIHVAKITPKGGFEWVVPPKPNST